MGRGIRDGRGLALKISIERGTCTDYRELEHFHYVARPLPAIAGIWRAVVRDPARRGTKRLIAVGVLTFPTPAQRARERLLLPPRLRGKSRYGRKRLRFINRHVRRIARVIVHPQFRSLGVATRLVRRVLLRCPTRYVEAVAAMGEVVPFFQRAGMTRVPPVGEERSAYFLFDRLKRERSKAMKR
jgi:GNAT superfamily N-acetyltransferase